MLVRKQILLEEKQANDIAEIAMMYNMSLSEIMRIGADLAVKDIKIKKKKSKIDKQYEAMDHWIANPVKGPGDSEYDKYAYDF